MKRKSLAALRNGVTKPMEATPAEAAAAAVLVEVRQPGYIPEGVRLRAQVGPTIFTADLAGATLAELRADPLVLAASPAAPMASYAGT